MPLPGPKPKPTALKVIEGNRGKRPLNRREPKPKGELAGPPSWLDATGKAEWRRILEALPAGQVTALDWAILAMYCERFAHFVAAIRRIRRSGGVLVKGCRGVTTKHPAVQIARDAANDCARLGAELGFTPSARSRLELPELDEDDAASIMRPTRVRGGR